jgi:hypothetical protein
MDSLQRSLIYVVGPGRLFHESRAEVRNPMYPAGSAYVSAGRYGVSVPGLRRGRRNRICSVAHQQAYLPILRIWRLDSGSEGVSPRDHDRITRQVVEYYRSHGARVRVLERPGNDEQALQFHPQLFECKGSASDLLNTAGFTWFSDYSSIDLLHEEFGLEICGIREDSSVEAIARAMRDGFPAWHYSHLCFKDGERDPGWKFALHMFPRGCGDGRCPDADLKDRYDMVQQAPAGSPRGRPDPMLHLHGAGA